MINHDWSLYKGAPTTVHRKLVKKLQLPLLACFLLLVSLSPDCSISQVWLTIDSSFLRSGGHKSRGTRDFALLYLVPGWCECKGSNGAGEAGEGFQRAVGSLVVECPVVGVS